LILHVLALETDPKRAQIGNVFSEPKKHRLPHFDNTAERSPMLLGATRDHLDPRREYFVIIKLKQIL